jgi:hypothetical protein
MQVVIRSGPDRSAPARQASGLVVAQAVMGYVSIEGYVSIDPIDGVLYAAATVMREAARIANENASFV